MKKGKIHFVFVIPVKKNIDLKKVVVKLFVVMSVMKGGLYLDVIIVGKNISEMKDMMINFVNGDVMMIMNLKMMIN